MHTGHDSSQYQQLSGHHPILDLKEFLTSQGQNQLKKIQYHDDVKIIGCKDCCSSVWCSNCYKQKGGSKRFSNRLALMDYRFVRQLILTVDPKKFPDGQTAFEYIRDKKAIAQYMRDLQRTSGVKIIDWAWCLEWHKNGFPHWHLFVQVEKSGRAGMIGNEVLLRHWKYGLVREQYIHNEQHWKRFTEYFAKNGYFNPKNSGDDRKKHQLELPEWAKKVSYRIRKTGSKPWKKEVNDEPEQFIEDAPEQFIEDAPEQFPREQTFRTYKEILKSCGQATYCQIWRTNDISYWKKIKIPYRDFKRIPGEYIEHVGYEVQMARDEFLYFLMDNDSNWNSRELIR